MQAFIGKSDKMFARLHEEMSLDLDAFLKKTAIRMLKKDFHSDPYVIKVKSDLKQNIFKVMKGSLIDWPGFNDWKRNNCNSLFPTTIFVDYLAVDAYYDLFFTFQMGPYKDNPDIKDVKEIPQLGTDLEAIKDSSKDSILIALRDIKKELERLNDTINDKLTNNGSQAELKGK